MSKNARDYIISRVANHEFENGRIFVRLVYAMNLILHVSNVLCTCILCYLDEDFVGLSQVRI